jgi:hypothetical protein
MEHPPPLACAANFSAATLFIACLSESSCSTVLAWEAILQSNVSRAKRKNACEAKSIRCSFACDAEIAVQSCDSERTMRTDEKACSWTSHWQSQGA